MLILFGFIFGSFLGLIGFGYSTWQYWILILFFFGAYELGKIDSNKF